MFVSGKRSEDPLHPDYVPSLFSFTSITDRVQAFDRMERYLQSGEVSEKTLAAAALLNLHKTPAAGAVVKTQVQDVKIKTEELEEVEAQGIGVQTEAPHPVEVQSTTVQTDETHADIASLHQQIKSLNTECQSLRDNVHKLESGLNHLTLDPSQFDDDKIKFFTGLPNLLTFMVLFSHMSSDCPAAAHQSLKPTQELLLTLMKLRLKLPEKFLGYLFGVHQTSVSRIFRRWKRVIDSKLHVPVGPEREDAGQTSGQANKQEN